MAYTGDDIVFVSGESAPDKYITWGKLKEVLAEVDPDVRLRCSPVTRNLMIEWPLTGEWAWVDFAEETLFS